MTENTSLPVVDIRDSIDARVNAFFVDFFLPRANISENDYELIKSFCVAKTRNTEAASSLIAAIISVINELDLYAPDVIDQFKQGNFTQQLPLFLNLSRRGISLLGYMNTQPVPPRIQQQVLT